ncbi:MAG: exopolysaccharide biosynthesis protein [Aliiglaciecola sp.]
MIDLHSHILPGIDDGARSMQQSLEMARQAVVAGVTHMVCTPHIHPNYFDNSYETINPVFNEFRLALATNKIPLSVTFAAEIRLSADIPVWIKQQQILYIGHYQSRQAVMLELPHSHIPAGTDNLIKWMIANKVQPIVVHPERNRDIWKDYSKIMFLRRAGAIFQVTAGAFIGRFSEVAQQIAERMLDESLISFVASDTHDIERRPNDMLLCKKRLIELKGENVADELTLLTPKEITKLMEWH